MLRDEERLALFVEVHRAVAEASTRAAGTVGVPNLRADLAYPPGTQLSEGELAALRGINLTPDARSALQKVIADACSAAFFRMFTVMDGVGDPEDWSGEVWQGVSLGPKPEHDEPMLHDEFFESYWQYKEG